MSRNLAGALLMVASMSAFVFNDMAIKLTGGVVPLFQLIFVRGLLATTLICALAYAVGGLRLRLPRADWGWIVLRGLSEVMVAYFFLAALLNMPLANVTAILQSVPLMVTLAAALIYRERVGWPRLLAIAIGFCGVLLVVQPGADGFTRWSLFALGAALCVTARDMITRRISSQAPGWMVTLGTSLCVTLAAGLGSTSETWVSVAPPTAALIALSAFSIVAGYFFSVQVMRTGDVSFTAPFRYTGLLFAIALGIFVFGEIPTAPTVLGAAIIMATGLFTLYREARVRRVPHRR
ncbi:DMT family transporter [Sulfitobacter sp. S190]|uniref:DMT family transporter n=1 Tax=Sulfitobacter sp. S190 TaxID=2867022 RepID=UPI0021A7196A|nr:DMT family transporter [Sulfitobacter sp. S190]UWR22952.1 DMT family transporter [Sulfitobacter sp. S190]